MELCDILACVVKGSLDGTNCPLLSRWRLHLTTSAYRTNSVENVFSGVDFNYKYRITRSLFILLQSSEINVFQTYCGESNAETPIVKTTLIGSEQQRIGDFFFFFFF